MKKGRPKTTLEDFVNRAREIHGDAYDYGNVDLIGSLAKVSIYCNTCREYFLQRPSDHYKAGCKKCAIAKTAEISFKRAKNAFVSRSKDRHGDKFDYSKTDYTGVKNKVILKCNIHDVEFSTWPATHLKNKGGCPVCAIKSGTAHAVKRKEKCIETFIKKANKEHKYKYDYSLTFYTNSHTKLKIICPHHGVYIQNPVDHLRCGGCPVCRQTRFSKDAPAMLYYIKFDTVIGPMYKIGITNFSVDRRFRRFKEYRKTLKTWTFKNGFDAKKAEAAVLKYFSDYRYKGKKLIMNGNTELFKTDVLGFDI